MPCALYLRSFCSSLGIALAGAARQCPAAHKTAIFRQVNVDCLHAHHDALEFPDGEIVLLTYLMEGQEAAVLQLPAAAVGSKATERAAYV
jgi:hypothetical protein